MCNCNKLWYTTFDVICDPGAQKQSLVAGVYL